MEKRMDFHKNSLDKNSMLRGRRFLIGKMKKVIRIFKL